MHALGPRRPGLRQASRRRSKGNEPARPGSVVQPGAGPFRLQQRDEGDSRQGVHDASSELARTPRRAPMAAPNAANAEPPAAIPTDKWEESTVELHESERTASITSVTRSRAFTTSTPFPPLCEQRPLADEPRVSGGRRSPRAQAREAGDEPPPGRHEHQGQRGS